jgi:hypothetical protein
MARYFFHVTDGRDYPDLQGTELPDLGAAKREAVRFAATLLAEHADKFWDTGEWHLRVADEHNLTLFQMTFFATEAPSISLS